MNNKKKNNFIKFHKKNHFQLTTKIGEFLDVELAMADDIEIVGFHMTYKLVAVVVIGNIGIGVEKHY